MFREVRVVRISDDGDVYYEVRDQNDCYLTDHPDLVEALEKAGEFAEAHNIEFVQVQVATEAV